MGDTIESQPGFLFFFGHTTNQLSPLLELFCISFFRFHVKDVIRKRQTAAVRKFKSVFAALSEAPPPVSHLCSDWSTLLWSLTHWERIPSEHKCETCFVLFMSWPQRFLYTHKRHFSLKYCSSTVKSLWWAPVLCQENRSTFQVWHNEMLTRLHNYCTGNHSSLAVHNKRRACVRACVHVSVSDGDRGGERSADTTGDWEIMSRERRGARHQGPPAAWTILNGLPSQHHSGQRGWHLLLPQQKKNKKKHPTKIFSTLTFKDVRSCLFGL